MGDRKYTDMELTIIVIGQEVLCGLIRWPFRLDKTVLTKGSSVSYALCECTIEFWCESCKFHGSYFNFMLKKNLFVALIHVRSFKLIVWKYLYKFEEESVLWVFVQYMCSLRKLFLTFNLEFYLHIKLVLYLRFPLYNIIVNKSWSANEVTNTCCTHLKNVF